MSDEILKWNDDWHTTCPHCSVEDDDLEWESYGMPIEYHEASCNYCGTTWSYGMVIANVKITVPKEE